MLLVDGFGLEGKAEQELLWRQQTRLAPPQPRLREARKILCDWIIVFIHNQSCTLHLTRIIQPHLVKELLLGSRCCRTLHTHRMSNPQLNPFLLAADNSERLLPLLRQDASLASSQDEHGYSLVHAAASYNNLDLLRVLVNELHASVDLKDEDGETALFVVETADCAKVLVEELHANILTRGIEGKTAREKIEEEGDFPEIAVYLRIKELENDIGQTNGSGISATAAGSHPPPPLPEGLSVNFGTMVPEEAGELVDPEFRRKIEELAQREDFQGEDGQRQLRELITEAIRGDVGHQQNVRRRTD